MRSYFHKGQCVVCGKRQTAETLLKYQMALSLAKIAIKHNQEGVVVPTECCEVPDYIPIREFATAYYGKVWYFNPDSPSSYKKIQEHIEEVVFMSNMYHLYRFGNYTDLRKYFRDYDNGDIVIARITDNPFKKWQRCALDPESGLGARTLGACYGNRIPWRIDDSTWQDQPDVAYLRAKFGAIECRREALAPPVP